MDPNQMVQPYVSIGGSNPPTGNSAHAPDVAQNPNADFWYSMYASNQAGSSSLDHEWGHVLEKSHEMKKKKKRKNGGSSSVINSASDISEALSAVSAALSLSSSSYDSDKEDFKRLPYLVGSLDDENGDNSTKKHRSSFDIQSFSSESDGEDLVLSDYSGGDMLAETNFSFSEEMQICKSQVPELGMVFPSEEEAYKFYQTYALKTGFSVRKGKVQRLSNGTIRKRYFFCSRQGFRSQNQSNKITKYKRKETRTGCNAKIQYTFEKGKWVISQISHEHNHHLEDPRHMLASCTKTSKAGLIFRKKDEADMTLKCLEDVNDTENRGHLEKKHAELHYKHDYGVYNRPPEPVRKDDLGEGLGISPSPSPCRMEFGQRSGDGGVGNQNVSKDQSAFLEVSFKEHATLNPKNRLALAKQMKLRPRQRVECRRLRREVEVLFQNRRARSRLKMMEEDFEHLRRCGEHLRRQCETLTEENRRLQKEMQELRGLKLRSLSTCTSCHHSPHVPLLVSAWPPLQLPLLAPPPTQVSPLLPQLAPPILKHCQ